jgi:hypothetical protein
LRRWAPALIVLLLLGGTAIAFATTERQKLEKTPFAVIGIDEVFSPVCRCKTGRATLALRFRKKHVLTVQIRDADDRLVRTLTNEQTVGNEVVDVRWDGRNDAGEVVADGGYLPRIVLDNGREFNPPNPIRVDSVPPRATLISYRPRVLRRSNRSRLHVRYRFNESAHPLLYVNGHQVVRGIGTALVGKFDWGGRRDDRLLRPGRYRLQLAAVDLAGNVGERTTPFVVRIRK